MRRLSNFATFIFLFLCFELQRDPTETDRDPTEINTNSYVTNVMIFAKQKGQKPGKCDSNKVKLECPNRRPIVVSPDNPQELQCGKEIPSTKNCYESDSCVRNAEPLPTYDFATTIICLRSEKYGYACNFTCCSSQLYGLKNCKKLSVATMGKRMNKKVSLNAKSGNFTLNIYHGELDICHLQIKTDCKKKQLRKRKKLATTTEGCGPIDLIILLDKGSLHPAGFFSEMQLADRIFKHFTFNHNAALNQSRSALIVFGHYEPQTVWDLPQYEKSDNADAELHKHLYAIPYQNSAESNTFRYIYENLSALDEAVRLWKKASDRPNVRKITLLVSEGISATSTASTLKEKRKQLASAMASIKAATGEDLYSATTSLEYLIEYPGVKLERTVFSWTAKGLSVLAKTIVSQICKEKPRESTGTRTGSTKTIDSSTVSVNSVTPAIKGCSSYYDVCETNKDCCNSSSATFAFRTYCIRGYCMCSSPGFSTKDSGTCCDGQLESTDSTCPRAHEFGYCDDVAAGCAHNLTCVETTETGVATYMDSGGFHAVCLTQANYAAMFHP